MDDGIRDEIQILRDFIYDYMNAMDKPFTPKDVKEYYEHQISQILERLRSWGY